MKKNPPMMEDLTQVREQVRLALLDNDIDSALRWAEKLPPGEELLIMEAAPSDGWGFCVN